MYNEKFEQLDLLITVALLDGVLTEKEKQVLFKRAQELGIDLDEFEMILEAFAAKVRKSLAAKRKAEEVRRKEERTSSGMVLEYDGRDNYGRNELTRGTRVFVPTKWGTSADGTVCKDAIPEIRECLRDMGIALNFNNAHPFAVYADGIAPVIKGYWKTSRNTLMFWKEV